MKKPWTDRFSDFMARKGFYIVLFLCVAAIGISGYYLFSTLGGDDPAAPVGGTAQVTVTPSPSVSPSPTVDAVKPTIPATASSTPTPSATPAPSASDPSLNASGTDLRLSSVERITVGSSIDELEKELIKYLRQGEKASSHPGVTFTKMASNIVWTSQNTCGIVCVAEKKNKKGAKNHGSSKHPSCKRTA